MPAGRDVVVVCSAVTFDRGKLAEQVSGTAENGGGGAAIRVPSAEDRVFIVSLLLLAQEFRRRSQASVLCERISHLYVCYVEGKSVSNIGALYGIYLAAPREDETICVSLFGITNRIDCSRFPACPHTTFLQSSIVVGLFLGLRWHAAT